MSDTLSPKTSLPCTLLKTTPLTGDIIRLDFEWRGPAPKSGQFFMVKAHRSCVLLARPISVAFWDAGTVSFLVALRGKGTVELFEMAASSEGQRSADKAELIGPLGNGWGDAAGEFAAQGQIALVGGGIGVAPLLGFASELAGRKSSGGLKTTVDFFVGFRGNIPEFDGLLAAAGADAVVVATEDGSNGRRGLVTDYLDAAKYAAIYACGPEAMLKAVAGMAKKVGVPCFISMERRMACGVGACLGCTVRTVHGNKRCCTDGPVFSADEVIFDE
jgi:NAD(P)H-flavin reductase